MPLIAISPLGDLQKGKTEKQGKNKIKQKFTTITLRNKKKILFPGSNRYWLHLETSTNKYKVI